MTGKLPEMQIELDGEGFVRDLLRELSATLEQVVGLDEAASFVSLVGQSIGAQINARYRHALDCSRLSRSQVPEVLVDLKRRIGGTFRTVPSDDGELVLENTVCPFGERVTGRPSMCMMTSNVFGTIVSENLGYAKVVLEKTIAQGDGCCRVVVKLEPASGDDEAGREYFRTEDLDVA